MRKLLLKCGYSPGDIVMLTAAVRDLHHWYPRRFITDVQTACPEIWENNPHLTPLTAEDPEVEPIECHYPLIDRCNHVPYHCLHGFIQFLNEHLQLAIKPTLFKGDIHLSSQEKAWHSQVRELTGADTPYWIVAAGGKYDVSVKWWETGRYQKVIDHFRGKIQFVQVGSHGHHHPRLNGVIDLRGKTNLRELIRLVHHAQGVLCSVTALMHLAAAVETRNDQPASRPCVVVAGGREPAHWEAYPGHQFVHTNGMLPCCTNGGCWKDRTVRLKDGDSRDGAKYLCVDVINQLPRCMDMITPGDIIRRIEMYFNGSVIRHLSEEEKTAASRGVTATSKNAYDRQPLNIHNAGMACEQFIQRIPAYPNRFQGRGIVICGGGFEQFTNAWVCVNMLRWLGCNLPIQLWHLESKELNERMIGLLAPLGVECVNASKVRKKYPARILQTDELKPYAILQSPFRELLVLDADTVPVVNPEFLFDTLQFRSTGAVFWTERDQVKNPKGPAIWRSCGTRRFKDPGIQTRQLLVDKQRCWPALSLCLWFSENSDFYHRHLRGNSETFPLAFRKMRKSYSLETNRNLAGTGARPGDFEGQRVFQQRKWDCSATHNSIEDFWFEEECRGYIAQLQRAWNARSNAETSSTRPPSGDEKRSWRAQSTAISITDS